MDNRTHLLQALEGEIDCDSVMIANARTSCAFSARVVGHFVRKGANSWDPSEFLTEEGQEVRVFPGVKVQVEPAEGWFRMRYRGEVCMFAWQPDAAEPEGTSGRHEAFVSSCVEPFSDAGGIGAMAFIARTLDD